MLGKWKQIYFWLSLGRGHRGLVLDVGSGNSPHPRADVLCDRYPGNTRHRHGARLVQDRAFVCGDICALPFETGAYDFVVARHVLEHLEPAQIPLAVAELTRVARAGYIETPSPICEMLMPDPEHKCFVEVSDGTLTFIPKQQIFPFPPVARALLEWRKNNPAWQQFIENNAPLLVTTFRWEGSVHYAIESPRLCPARYEASPEDLCAICDIAQAEGLVSSRSKRWAKALFRLAFRIGGAKTRRVRAESHSGKRAGVGVQMPNATTSSSQPGSQVGGSWQR